MAGALVMGGGALLSGVLGSNAAEKAASTQSQAETAALYFQEQQAAKQNPFINAGTGAVNQLGGLFGIGPNGQPTGQSPDYSAFKNSPDYLFAQQQGNDALRNYLNATGTSMSGAGIASALQFNQGLATQQYGNYFNRLMQLSQLGSGAAANNNQAASSIANTQGAIGQSQAAGIVGSTNAITGGINNALLLNAVRGGGNPSGYGGSGSQFASNPFNSPLSNPGNVTWT